MLFTTTLSMLALAAQQEKDPDLATALTGTFTNEEQNYFEADAGREAPPWTGLRIAADDNGMTVTEIDKFGKALSAERTVTVNSGAEQDVITVDNCARNFERSDQGWAYARIQNRMACNQDWQIIRVTEDALTLRLADGTQTVLNRARDVECWAAVPKKAKKPDGSTDWLFVQKLNLHDQGGRVSVGGGESGAEEIILRMRAVHWPPPSTNRPSMVLYVHKPDNPERAVSYSWADINASRIGLNLRWMQASCTIKGAERASEITSDTFRG
ncbi:hypothetical protein SAMN02745824_0269 [Parasphingorhabdus marina DSM 22363]|uniref:Uncharacterized protein n=1 Tax=Parasphingorhabdus marina DSM 22363 TaxID=1123272 RepID=A0A1N6CMF8_9SPHN|nr:hypothetical protein [Parasphingorhabdus marina]SIN59733.1 hypothetical protein SAMN02745824_0269 [Parasphingorhabdus marina DSM 22363]